MARKAKKTVTIGIPAHNEELNLPILLDSILMQSKSNFILERLIVACDGCTDNTAKIVEAYSKKYKFIKLINDGKRLGKPTRMDNFYKNNKSDILINFDADVRLAHKKVIEKLVLPFANNNVGLVGGRNIPLTPKTSIGKMAYAWTSVWDYIRHNHNDGNTLISHHGCISAISGNAVKKINYPKNSASDDAYIYYSILSKGFKYEFVKEAVVYYWLPSNYSDYLKQSLRFLKGAEVANKSYLELSKKEPQVPLALKIEALLVTLKKHYIWLFMSIFLQIWIRTLSKWYTLKVENGIWETAKSTKLGATS